MADEICKVCENLPRKQWLNNVMATMAASDPVKLMLQHIKNVMDADTPIDEKEEALEEVEMYCEDVDIANDFHKIGGFELIKALLQAEHAGLRWRACDVIATVVQNNPYCQEMALESGFLPTLLKLLDNDDDTQVRIKALYAISCLTRDVPESQKVFVENDGFSVLIRALQTEHEKLQTKAAFLMSALFVSQPAFKDTVCDLGMVEQFVALLHHEHTQSHEHLMSALLRLIEDHPRAVSECRRPELGLAELLQARKALLQGKEEFEEELAHCTSIYGLVFAGSGGTNVER